MSLRLSLVTAGILSAERAAVMTEAQFEAFIWREVARDDRERAERSEDPAERLRLTEDARRLDLLADKLDPPRVPWVEVDQETQHGDPPGTVPVRLSRAVRVF